ncbi:hypothetical protein [Bilophila wadsworthia]|uniref:hypothetical protein n=1 Tax=Bilophila wadsworthia TaxID=35833 RepID=UPI003AB836E3
MSFWTDRSNRNIFFALYAERHAAYLVRKGFFSQEEIEENKAVIGKALMQACLMFNDYVVADEDGNTIEAQKILAKYLATANPSSVPAASPAPPPAPKKLLYSEAVEKYIAAKLQENAWKPHNVPDIRTRLLNFVEIKGDMPLEDISRQDMRSFMETLQKLPPHRNKNKKYAGKSIAEVLAMNPEQTLNVATINTASKPWAACLSGTCEKVFLTEIRPGACRSRTPGRPSTCGKRFRGRIWSAYLRTPSSRKASLYTPPTSGYRLSDFSPACALRKSRSSSARIFTRTRKVPYGSLM